jgi:hypothetical protein
MRKNPKPESEPDIRKVTTKQGDTEALTVSFNLKKWTILGLVKAEQLGPSTAAN